MSITTFQACLLWGTGLLLIILIISDYLRRKSDLLNIRNIMLGGFIVYQILSPANTLFSQRAEKFRIYDMADAGWQYLILMYPFLFCMLIAYKYGWGVKKLAHRFPVYRGDMTEQTLLFAAVLGTVGAILIRLIPPVPGIIHASFFISTGLATASTGLITWWWMRRSLNVNRLVVVLMVTFANLVIVTSGSFSRRPIIAITLMFTWAVYYANVRYQHNRTKVLTMVLSALLPLVILGSLFTSARNQSIREDSGLDIVKMMFVEGNISEGLEDMLGGQLVGEGSLWCVENFPEHLQQDHLLSLRYYFLANIPRSLWPGKPYVLSTRVADLADIEGVRQDRSRGGTGVTLPPGVVGYIAAEGGIYAALIYGLVIGLIARFLDELIVCNAHRVLIIIPIAASLGNMLGLLRGDLAMFSISATWSMVASYLFIFTFTFFFGQSTEQTQPVPALR
jgi:hypothetical protein